MRQAPDSESRSKGHDDTYTEGVDRRVCYLRKTLLEVTVQDLGAQKGRQLGRRLP
jgi:hypothetical protein